MTRFLSRTFINSLILIGCCVWLPALGWAQEQGESKRPTALMLGNSYTAYNDLKGMIAALAAADGAPIEIDARHPGGYTLTNHAGEGPQNGREPNQKSINKIQSRKWDHIVLQEQSVLPAVEQLRERMFLPGGRSLAKAIRENHESTQIVLFMTWGRKDGLEEGRHGLKDFETMQRELERAYNTLGEAIDAKVAPVGLAFWRLREAHNDTDLYRRDGSHPNARGTYLAALVIHATLFDADPANAKWKPDSIQPDDAKALQRVAADTIRRYAQREKPKN